MTQVNFRIDDQLKNDLDSVLSELGISLSTAMNIYAKKIVREKRIPFELSLNAETIAALEESEQIRKNIDSHKKVNTINDLLEELESE